MNNKIKNIVLEVFDTDNYTIIKRLMGGRSNYTYIIEVDNALYTLRIPGKNGNLFVDRVYEKSNLNKVNKIRINNETIYLNTETGVKVSKYINGIDLESSNINDYYKEVADVLHMVHNSPAFNNDYKPFDRLAEYESLCYDLEFEHGDKYHELKGWLLKRMPLLMSGNIYPCHNDSQASNFIVGDDNKLYLTDWEFAGNNDVYYDIACFGDCDFSRALTLLEFYEKDVLDEHVQKVYLWRIFQMLQWCNVAAYKHLIGLSQELEIDFEEVSKNYVKSVEILISELVEKYNDI